LGVLAVGMTFVIISGGIDLSVGGVMAFSCVLVPIVAPLVGNHIVLICLCCITAGVLLGRRDGSLVANGNMQPFMATFGMATIAEGLGFLFSNGRPIILDDQTMDDLRQRRDAQHSEYGDRFSDRRDHRTIRGFQDVLRSAYVCNR
jgi:ribose/xylose/arabinose/galactoside ABC-type transport system permease subunit